MNPDFYKGKTWNREWTLINANENQMDRFARKPKYDGKGKDKRGSVEPAFASYGAAAFASAKTGGAKRLH